MKRLNCCNEGLGITLLLLQEQKSAEWYQKSYIKKTGIIYFRYVVFYCTFVSYISMSYVSTLIIQKAVDFHFFERLASKNGRINCHVFISFSFKYFLWCTNIVIKMYICVPVFLSKWIRWQKICVQLFGYVHDRIPDSLERSLVRNSDLSSQIW